MRLDRGGRGGGGNFVGLHPVTAGALAAAMAASAGEAAMTSSRVRTLLDQAGADGDGAATAHTLRGAQRWLETAATDVRWRITMLEASGYRGTGGMLLGSLLFPSALTARTAGLGFGQDIARALRAYVEADGDEAEQAALRHYLGLVRATSVYADDPAWSGGLIDALGSEGVFNALWFAGVWEQGDVAGTRQIVGPLATALATALHHRTARPEIRGDLLDLPVWDLGLLLAMAPPETNFLVSAARRMLVAAQQTGDRSDDPTDREYVFVLEALADNPEASFRFLTGRPGAYEPNVAWMLQPLAVLARPEAAVAAGTVLERGLVEYPAGKDAATWNRAVSATEDTIEFLARADHHLKWVAPQFNAAVAGLLRPHLDAVAVIGAQSAGVDPLGHDLGVPTANGRRSLDVAPETLRDFLGGVMQQDSGANHVQLLLGAYSQSASVQANRRALLDGPVRRIGPFIEDSLRIAGLAGVVGQGLDRAGHDEEARGRFLTGAFRFATGQGAKQIPAKTPAQWLAQQGAKYLAGHAVREFSEWVARFEPMEGEEGIDEFIAAYVDTTRASLAEHLASDPDLAALPAHQRAEALRVAMALVQGQVGEGLRPVYADLVGETEAER